MVADEMLISSNKILDNINFQLNQLETDIAEIAKMDNKVEAIIHLFQVVSVLEDAGDFRKNIAELKRTVTVLEALQGLLHGAGRDMYGINRTQVGETVTADNVYLGDVCGLFTHPASYWLEKRANLEPGFCPNEPESTWSIIHDYQCGSFVGSYVANVPHYIALLKGGDAEK